MPSGTPGLPQQLFGHTVRRRAKWIQLLVVNEQYRRSGFGFQFQLPGPRFLRQPRLRFSVALPLGINRANRHVNTSWNYHKQSAAIAFTAVRRTARAGRLPLGRPATFASSLRALPGVRPTKGIRPITPQGCQIRFFPISFDFGLRAPRVGRRPSAQVRRPCGSQELRPSLSGSSSAHSNSPFNAQPKSLDFDLSLIPV